MLVEIPRPWGDGFLLVDESWAWQPGERRLYVVHYEAWKAGTFVCLATADAWAYSPEEAEHLVREAAAGLGWVLSRVRVDETSPVVYDLAAGDYRPRERWREGWPLAAL